MNTIGFSKLFFHPFGTSLLNTLSWLHDLIIGTKKKCHKTFPLLVKSHFYMSSTYCCRTYFTFDDKRYCIHNGETTRDTKEACYKVASFNLIFHYSLLSSGARERVNETILLFLPHFYHNRIKQQCGGGWRRKHNKFPYHSMSLEKAQMDEWMWNFPVDKWERKWCGGNLPSFFIQFKEKNWVKRFKKFSKITNKFLSIFNFSHFFWHENSLPLLRASQNDESSKRSIVIIIIFRYAPQLLRDEIENDTDHSTRNVSSHQDASWWWLCAKRRKRKIYF